MLLINKVKLYSFDVEKETERKSDKNIQMNDIEMIGNKNSNICCLISCPSPISSSKDYKILSKVFEKLLLKIDNVLVVNRMTAQKVGFVHFFQEFSFNKIIIFGEESCLASMPLTLRKNHPSKYDYLQIMLTENLIDLTESTNTQLKQTCWNAIQSFYKL